MNTYKLLSYNYIYKISIKSRSQIPPYSYLHIKNLYEDMYNIDYKIYYNTWKEIKYRFDKDFYLESILRK